MRAIIDSQQVGIVLEALYEVAQISRQGYAKYKKSRQIKLIIDAEIVQKVEQLRKEHKRMGSRSLHYLSKTKSIDLCMGINKFEKRMSILGLTVKQKTKRVKTTRSVKHQYPNLISGLKIDNINQVVVGDITYYDSYGERYYIFTLKDLYSKRVVGLIGAKNMFAEIAVQAFKQMLRLRKKHKLKGLIHHTDAGGQYLSIVYKSLLKKCGVRISIAKNCLENGCSEQLNGIIKNDYLINYKVKNEIQLNSILNKIKTLINEEKPVKKMGFITPVEFERRIQLLQKKDRPEVVLYDFGIG